MDGIKIEVIGNIARVTERPQRITSGTVGLPIEFTFDSQWDGLSKTAVFRVGHSKKIVPELETEAIVPWELLQKPGAWLNVGVYGCNEDGSVAIPTIWVNVCVIQKGASPDGDPATDPTLPVWQKLLDDVGELQELDTTKKENLVKAVNEVYGGLTKEKTLRSLGDETTLKAAKEYTDTATESLASIDDLAVSDKTTWSSQTIDEVVESVREQNDALEDRVAALENGGGTGGSVAPLYVTISPETDLASHSSNEIYSHVQNGGDVYLKFPDGELVAPQQVTQDMATFVIQADDLVFLWYMISDDKTVEQFEKPIAPLGYVDEQIAQIRSEIPDGGKYELIETITITEPMSIQRSQEPDGTPYKFRGLRVFVKSNANEQAVLNFYLYNSKKSGYAQGTFGSITAGNTVTKYAYVQMENAHGLWKDSWFAFGDNLGASAWFANSYRTLALNTDFSKYDYVASILSSTAVAAGTTIEIWGWRL